MLFLFGELGFNTTSLFCCRVKDFKIPNPGLRDIFNSGYFIVLLGMLGRWDQRFRMSVPPNTILSETTGMFMFVLSVFFITRVIQRSLDVFICSRKQTIDFTL